VGVLVVTTFRYGIAVAIAIVANARLSVALFVDIGDGPEFTKLLAREFLDTFAQVTDPWLVLKPDFDSVNSSDLPLGTG